MAFMVLLVQYLNKTLLIALLLMVCSCANRQHDMVRVSMGDAAFGQRGELVLYHNQPFTGASYSLYPSGDTARYIEYTKGTQNGLLKWWYPNKQLAQLRFFIDGKKQGVHRGWWENGTLKFEYHFTDDEHDGELKEWGSTGKPFRVFHYAMGHEQGSEKMWWEDGRIRANYVVINGEKFGLFGQKLCANGLKK
jgi:antitoxin component YwqK of YwqJK toxin-antitoxin module